MRDFVAGIRCTVGAEGYILQVGHRFKFLRNKSRKCTRLKFASAQILLRKSTVTAPSSSSKDGEGISTMAKTRHRIWKTQFRSKIDEGIRKGQGEDSHSQTKFRFLTRIKKGNAQCSFFGKFKRGYIMCVQVHKRLGSFDRYIDNAQMQVR